LTAVVTSRLRPPVKFYDLLTDHVGCLNVRFVRARNARRRWEAPLMKFPHRRQFLHLAAGAAALPAVSGVARAQAYPTRPVRIVVPIAPGGATYASQIVDKLNGEIGAALSDAKMKAKLADLGAVTLTLSPAAFGKLIGDEVEKWAKVVKFANIKAE
jgi:hypothetical protein